MLHTRSHKRPCSVGRGCGSCEGGQKAVSQTLQLQVRHVRMLGWSTSPRGGSRWGGRSSRASQGFSNNGLGHQPALYSWDKEQELGVGVGAGRLLANLVPSGHGHGQRCWSSLGWAWSIPLTPLLLTGQLLAPSSGVLNTKPKPCPAIHTKDKEKPYLFFG